MRRIKVQSLLLIVIIDNKNLLVGWLSLEHSHLGIQKLLKCKIEYIIHKINPTSLSLSLSLFKVHRHRKTFWANNGGDGALCHAWLRAPSDVTGNLGVGLTIRV